MKFGNPQVFWMLLLFPIGVIFYIWSFQKKRQAFLAFGNAFLMKKLTSAISLMRQVIKAGLNMAGFCLLTLALVQPQFGTRLELVHRKGIDIIIALDTSLSMLAEDIKPNRLSRARYEIQDLINNLEGDRIGLVAFAGQSFVLCPLTLDYNAAKLFLDTIDTDLISVKGTAIAEAIRIGTKGFNAKEKKYKVLILITDGEDHSNDSIQAAREAADAGVRIFAVGVGTSAGELIPIGKGSRIGFLKDRNGRIVKTRLEERSLQQIALETDGAYLRSQRGGVGLDEIYTQISQMEQKDLGSRKYTKYIHRYQWPLALALFCFFSESFLSDRRRKLGEWRGRFQS